MPSNRETMLTVSQVSEILNLKPRSARQFVRSIPHFKLNQRIIRIRLSDFEAWLEKHRHDVDPANTRAPTKENGPVAAATASGPMSTLPASKDKKEETK